MHQLPTRCPICAEELYVLRVGCAGCATTIEGRFELGWIGKLNREQLAYVELLLKNRGNVNAVAAELKVAYNTARSRLDDIVSALGYQAPTEPRHERRAVLDRVAAGELSVEAAMQMLRG